MNGAPELDDNGAGLAVIPPATAAPSGHTVWRDPALTNASANALRAISSAPTRPTDTSSVTYELYSPDVADQLNSPEAFLDPF